ncbi:COG4705 family protein [Kitasatospora azatica]|uniref:COG4705 family protein n=1 Tax=Kitasatospora azatica TaxID=58347 RepID=UPI000A065BB5|nr:hypothetical protein [Kitasatospora azatica]
MVLLYERGAVISGITVTESPRQRAAAPSASALLTKVPAVTAVFWLTKVLTTGMGETTSDYLARTVGPVPAVAGAALLLAGSLALQLRTRRYVVGVYWLAVVMVSVFGTMAADVLHVAVGVPYLASTIGFSVVLLALFALWYRVEGTLSVHSITGLRRELFYWAAVMTTFALGTAVGDLTASTVGLGYLSSGFLFAALIAVPALAYRWLRLGPILAFWWAYVLTRPLGASFADWVGVSKQRGGLDLGTGPVSLAVGVVVLGLVVLLSRRERGTSA